MKPAIALVAFVLGILAASWHYSERLELYQAELDAKEDTIHRYRQALGIEPSPNTEGPLVMRNMTFWSAQSMREGGGK